MDTLDLQTRRPSCAPQFLPHSRLQVQPTPVPLCSSRNLIWKPGLCFYNLCCVTFQRHAAYKHFAFCSQRTLPVFVTKTNQLSLFWGIICVYCKSRYKNVNILYGQKELCLVKHGGKLQRVKCSQNHSVDKTLSFSLGIALTASYRQSNAHVCRRHAVYL